MTYQVRVERAIQELQKGKMIILTDHPDRENEGDLIFPAENISSEIMSKMIRYGSGIVCLSLPEEKLKKLGLPLMVSAQQNTSQRGTPFTISIEAKEGVTTGVSAADRAHTIRVAMNDNTVPDDLAAPGHVFPLQAKAGGVLERAGHTEGALELVQLAGFKAGAVLCEIMNDDGTMTRGVQLDEFAKIHDLFILAIDDLIAYRQAEISCSTTLPIASYGEFCFNVIHENDEHIFLTRPVKNSHVSPLVRIHSSCVTGDLFGSERCDCNRQLHYSLQRISEEGGMLIYLNQEGRGIGLANKIKAYALQEKGLDTVEANQHLGLPVDARDYSAAAKILKNRNMQSIRLLTNNPNKIAQLKKYGIANIEREKMPVFMNAHNRVYLETKCEKLNHQMGEIA